MGRRDTRRQLILAAERLFADRGIEGVSLREINLAAGQRNTSAAHYHFGSKEALVDAIFEFRRPELGKRRDEWFDRLESEGRADDLRSLVEAFVTPLADEARSEDSQYLMFLAHLFLHTPGDVGEILRKHEAGEQRWSALVRAALSNIPAQLVMSRLWLMGRHVVISLAVYQRRGLGIGDQVGGFEVYLSNMIDAVTAYLSCPVSEATKAQVRAARASAGSAPPKDASGTG